MGYELRVEMIPSARPTAIVRRRATMAQLPKVIPEACGTVWNMVKARGIKGAGRHVAVYLDDEMNLEIGVEVEEPIQGDDELIASSLPSGRVVTTVHFGPYQQLKAAHQAIQDWCKANGQELVRPCWEVYGHWLDEWNTDPSKIRTDVCYLLK